MKKYRKKVSNIIKKELDSKLAYNGKTKIKYYNRKYNTNFHNNILPKEGECICLSVILIVSVYRKDKEY